MWAASFDPVDFEQAFSFFRGRVAMSREAADQLTLEARQRAFWVSHIAEADVIQDVYGSLERALTDGTTFEQFQDDVAADLLTRWVDDKRVPNPLWRLETIFRTNLQTAYGAGRLEQLNDAAILRARPYWMYDALIDGRTSSICQEFSGTILPADSPWWFSRFPPNHYNCRSSVRSLTQSQVDARGGITQTPTADNPNSDWRVMPSLEPFELKTYSPEIGAIVEDKVTRS